MAVYKAIVTGGAKGIGYEISSTLLQAVGKVCILDVSASEGTKAQKTFDEKYGSGKAVLLQCDVSKLDQLHDAFHGAKSQMGGLNVVVNNAGVSANYNKREGMDRLEKMLSINLGAVIHGSMLGLELMGRNNGGNGGVIINMASVAGLDPYSIIPVYASTKAGVIHFSRCIAQTSQNDHGVRVNCMCPHFVYSDMSIHTCTAVWEGRLDVPQEYASIFPKTNEEARKMFMKPSDISDQVMKLIKDESKTGQVLYIAKNVEDPDKHLNIEHIDFNS